MKTALFAIVCGIAVVAASLLLSFGAGVQWAVWMLWPGILFYKVAFKNYYAESHMVGWSSGLEIASMLFVSVIVYTVIASFLIRHFKRSSRSSE